ncbi:Ldh family oxidoreductase [Streptosporangium amethystogenes]|uniref:Ldh family oxidoreductase n=1 Tax=Streptosporangium amethystogenes TaxID=2002 RepID=UPI0004C9D6E7|nr:Ldh family oxidoreductase [Streptosporangium amethystogenes]
MLKVDDLVITVGAKGNEVVLLRGADLRIPAGSSLLIQGERGSGKSTLCKVLCGELEPRFGTVESDALIIDDADAMDPTVLADLLDRRTSQGKTTVLLATDGSLPTDRVCRLARGTLCYVDAESQPVPEPLRIPPATLKERSAAALRAAGSSDETAALVADVLVEADVRGHHSHGVGLLPTYLARVRQGGIDPLAEPVLAEQGAVARIDARNGFGQPAAAMAADWCAATAARLGVAAVAVHSNNHVGMMAAYRWPFQRQGVAGLLFNISGPSLAAPGAARPTLGSNAICMVTPTAAVEPFVVDFATGVVSIGKIRAAAQRGDQVPPEWLLDSRGRPSSDPLDLEKGGSVPVFGDYKGLCVTLIAEVLAGILGGQTVSPLVVKQRAEPGRPMGCTQLFVGLSTTAFGLDAERTSIDKLVQILRDAVVAGYPGQPPTPYFPDQAEAAWTARAHETGIPIPAAVATALGWSER